MILNYYGDMLGMFGRSPAGRAFGSRFFVLFLDSAQNDKTKRASTKPQSLTRSKPPRPLVTPPL